MSKCDLCSVSCGNDWCSSKTSNNGESLKLKKRLFIDLDEVLVDFNGDPRLKDKGKVRSPPEMYKKDFFGKLKPLDGAIEAMEMLLESGKYDIHILTKPVAESTHSYKEKADWIKKYIPELIHSITLTQDKTMLIGGILIDDDLRWSNGWRGKFIHFRRDIPSADMWKQVLKELL